MRGLHCVHCSYYIRIKFLEEFSLFLKLEHFCVAESICQKQSFNFYSLADMFLIDVFRVFNIATSVLYETYF